MKVLDSVLVALFTLAVVFLVLLILNILIKIFSLAIGNFSVRMKTEPVGSPKRNAPMVEKTLSVEENFSSGKLKLKDVDEPTAAMIMAIVSDESGIPLSELCFRSIKLVRKE